MNQEQGSDLAQSCVQQQINEFNQQDLEDLLQDELLQGQVCIQVRNLRCHSVAEVLFNIGLSGQSQHNISDKKLKPIPKPAFGWRSEQRSSVMSTTIPKLAPPKRSHDVSYWEQAPVNNMQFLRGFLPQLFNRTAQSYFATPDTHRLIMLIVLQNRCNACDDVDEAQG